jgi:hypothetical protein
MTPESREVDALELDEWRELVTAAYDLLDAAIPLALERLSAAGVSLEDQCTFWGRWIDLDAQIGEVFASYDDVLDNYLPDAPTPINCNLADLAAAIRRDAAHRRSGRARPR